MAAELARADRTGAHPSLLLLDLDHFRRINDVYGHAVGDRILREVARRLRGRMRGYDVLGRWGGEQFIVLAPGVPDDETLRTLAEQIRRLVGALPVAIDEETLLPVTVSVGAVRAGDALRSVEGLVDCANRALAAAKRRGRDRVQLFGDLTVEDLVAEEPEAMRLARALALSASARSGLPQVDAERVSDLAVSIAEQMGLRRGDGHALPPRGTVIRYRHCIGAGAHPDARRAADARDRLEYEGARARRRAPRAQRRGRERRGRRRGRARGVLRRHRLSGRAERAGDPARGAHRRLRAAPSRSSHRCSAARPPARRSSASPATRSTPRS